jgi:hypothetical protein
VRSAAKSVASRNDAKKSANDSIRIAAVVRIVGIKAVIAEDSKAVSKATKEVDNVAVIRHQHRHQWLRRRTPEPILEDINRLDEKRLAVKIDRIRL